MIWILTNSIITAVFAFVLASIGIVLGLLYKGIDRVLVARMQSRVGPPLTQPFRDVKKLLIKQDIIPDRSVKWLFVSMPVFALAVTIVILFYVPFLGLPPLLGGYGDLIVVIYLLIFPALAASLGAFSSGSPFAGVGGQRELIKLMSYEFPLAIAGISVAWLISINKPELDVFSLSVISNNPVWSLVGYPGFLGLVLIFISLLFVVSGELGRVPFDVHEADTEIAGGAFAEYSGRSLAMFYMTDAVKIVVIASLVIALFMPWNLSPFLGLSGLFALVADALFFLFKMFLIVFVSSIVIRTVAARLKITKIVILYWFYTTLVAFFGLLLIWIDTIVG